MPLVAVPVSGHWKDVRHRFFPSCGHHTKMSPPEKYMKVLDRSATVRGLDPRRMWISGSEQGNSDRITYLCPSGTRTVCLELTNGRFSDVLKSQSQDMGVSLPMLAMLKK